MHICLSINLNLEENHAKRRKNFGNHANRYSRTDSDCKLYGIRKKVDSYLSTWREHREHEHHNDIAFKEYHKESYIIEPHIPRFGSGEAKCVINQSVRGYDLYIMVDVTNYSMTYSLCGHTNHMSPDDHFADLKRVIAAVGGKARRITVILPFLYESRQHRRTARESLDCPLALQELLQYGNRQHHHI